MLSQGRSCVIHLCAALSSLCHTRVRAVHVSGKLVSSLRSARLWRVQHPGGGCRFLFSFPHTIRSFPLLVPPRLRMFIRCQICGMSLNLLGEKGHLPSKFIIISYFTGWSLQLSPKVLRRKPTRKKEGGF